MKRVKPADDPDTAAMAPSRRRRRDAASEQPALFTIALGTADTVAGPFTRIPLILADVDVDDTALYLGEVSVSPGSQKFLEVSMRNLVLSGRSEPNLRVQLRVNQRAVLTARGGVGFLMYPRGELRISAFTTYVNGQQTEYPMVLKRVDVDTSGAACAAPPTGLGTVEITAEQVVPIAAPKTYAPGQIKSITRLPAEVAALTEGDAKRRNVTIGVAAPITRALLPTQTVTAWKCQTIRRVLKCRIALYSDIAMIHARIRYNLPAPAAAAAAAAAPAAEWESWSGAQVAAYFDTDETLMAAGVGATLQGAGVTGANLATLTDASTLAAHGVVKSDLKSIVVTKILSLI